MENSKALLSFGALGWFQVIIQIQKYEYYVNNLPHKNQLLLRIAYKQDKKICIHILL